MSTTVSETNTDKNLEKSGARASRDQRRAEQQIGASIDHTEQAVAELVQGGVSTVRSLLPAAVVRPTELVDDLFRVVEQLVAAAHRLAGEFAQLLESGLDGMQRAA